MVPPKGPSGDQVRTKSDLSENQMLVLNVAADPQPIHALMEHSNRTNRTKFRNQVLRPLLDAGLVAMTIPDKPRSSQQRYRTTEAGEKILTSE